MFSGISLICFDLDDTLWPCMPTIQHAEACYYRWLAENKPGITRAYTLEELRQKRLQLRQRHPELAHDMSALRIASLHELAVEFNEPADWIEDAFGTFYRARQQVTFFDDVEPVLKTLKSRYQIAAVTNGNADIHSTELSHLFDYAVSAAEAGAAKPAPAVFELLQQKSGQRASSILHIGDHPVDDIEGARRAGIRSVWINRQRQGWSEPRVAPDFIIENLFELLPKG